MNWFLLFRIAIGYLRQHRLQSGLLVIGVALGVAVMVSIDIANASATRAFDLSTDAVAGRTTHQIFGGPTGIDDAVFVTLRKLNPQLSAAPVMQEYISLPALNNRAFTMLGIDPFNDQPFRNYLGNEDEAPLDQITGFLVQPNAVLISTNTAANLNVQSCSLREVQTSIPDTCRVEAIVSGQAVTLWVSGVIDPADDLSRRAVDSLILADIASVKEITGRVDTLDRIDLILQGTESQISSQIDELRSSLPAGLVLQSSASRSGSVDEMTQAFRINLTALSLLALLVGLFLIYNTITFSVIQRRPFFGTLRCLGMTRQQIFALVIGEAFVIGVVGSLLGLGLGVALGQLTVNLVTQTINDLFFVLNVRETPVPVEAIWRGLIVGVLATLLTAAPPAWEAAAVPPRTALNRSGLEYKASGMIRLAALAGVVIAILGVLILRFIQTTNLWISFGGTFAVIIGLAMITPYLTALLLGFLSRVTTNQQMIIRLAPRSLERSLSRTAIAIASLMVSVSVTIGVSLMISSFRSTVATWLEQTLQGDIYITAVGGGATTPGAPILPQVIEFMQVNYPEEELALIRSASVDSPQGSVQILAVDHPIVAQDLFIDAIGSPEVVWQRMQSSPPGEPVGILVSEPLATRTGIDQIGEIFELQTPQGLQSFEVIGLFYDFASPQGAIRIDMQRYQQIWGDEVITGASMIVHSDKASIQQITEQLQSQLGQFQQLVVRENAALRQEALDVFDRTFTITSAMQILATLVAFTGVLSALLGMLLERRREYGILRALGLTLTQITRLTTLQSALMGLASGILSLPTGYILALILVYVINKRSFGWTLQMQIDILPFALAMVIALSASLLAGIYPNYRLRRVVTAQAIRSE